MSGTRCYACINVNSLTTSATQTSCVCSGSGTWAADATGGTCTQCLATEAWYDNSFCTTCPNTVYGNGTVCVCPNNLTQLVDGSQVSSCGCTTT